MTQLSVFHSWWNEWLVHIPGNISVPLCNSSYTSCTVKVDLHLRRQHTFPWETQYCSIPLCQKAWQPAIQYPAHFDFPFMTQELKGMTRNGRCLFSHCKQGQLNLVSFKVNCTFWLISVLAKSKAYFENRFSH